MMGLGEGRESESVSVMGVGETVTPCQEWRKALNSDSLTVVLRNMHVY